MTVNLLCFVIRTHVFALVVILNSGSALPVFRLPGCNSLQLLARTNSAAGYGRWLPLLILFGLGIFFIALGGSGELRADEPVAEAVETADLSQAPDGTARTSQARGSGGLLLIGYCTAILLASIGGGWIPSFITLTHTGMQTVISFVGGLMLGIAVFHLLPHSLHGRQSPDTAAWWMMAGILTMFLLIRCFHFHHHGPLEISTEKEDPCEGHRDGLLNILPTGPVGKAHDHDHHHDCGHDHDHDSHHSHASHHSHQTPSQQLSTIAPPHCHHAHQLSWLGITVGLSLHTLLDGMALAASVQGESGHRVFMSLFGFGTFLAILLHKPLDAVSITSLMMGSGWNPRGRFWVNAGFAAMCPLGAAIFYFGMSGLHPSAVDSALAFSAGIFLCISLSDLLPEMEFHAHNRVRLTAALLAGILLAYGITFLEPAHLH